MSWLPGSERTPIGIDPAGRFVNAVQLSRSGNRWRVEAAASIPRSDSELPVDGEELVWLAGVLSRQGFRGRDVVLAMPSERLLTAVVDLPSRAAANSVAQIARAELAATHKCDPQSLELACWRLPGSARANSSDRVLAVGCRQDEASRLVDIFEAVGMRVRAIDIPSWAIARACTPFLGGSAPTVALLNVGWPAAALAIVCDEVVVYERSLTEHGLNRLYLAVADQHDLEHDVTDHIVSEIGIRSDLPQDQAQSDLVKAVRGDIINYLDNLVSEVRLSVSYGSQEYADGAVERLIIHGEGASMPGVAAYLSSKLDMKVRSVAPTHVADCPPSLSEICGLPVLSTALGLAQHPEK